MLATRAALLHPAHRRTTASAVTPNATSQVTDDTDRTSEDDLARVTDVTDSKGSTRGTDLFSEAVPDTLPVEFIVNHIHEHGGENQQLPTSDVIRAGKQAGYSERQLIAARSKPDSGVGSRKADRRDDPGAFGGWMWFLTFDPNGDDPQEYLTEERRRIIDQRIAEMYDR